MYTWGQSTLPIDSNDSREFLEDFSQIEGFTSKLLTFECNKIEEFKLSYGDIDIGGLHFGELQTTSSALSEPFKALLVSIKHCKQQ